MINVMCVRVVAGGEEVGVEISISPPVHHRSIIIPRSFTWGRPMANADFFNTQVGNDMDWDDSSVFSPPAQASASYYNGAPMHLPVNRHDALVTSTVALSSPPRSSSSSEEPRFDGPRQHAETAPHCAGRKVAPDPRPADPDMDSGIAS